MKRNISITMGMALVGVIAIIATLSLFSLNQAAPVEAQKAIPGAVEGGSAFEHKYFEFISPDDLEEPDNSKFIINLNKFTLSTSAGVDNIKVYISDPDQATVASPATVVATDSSTYPSAAGLGDVTKVFVEIQAASGDEVGLIGQRRMVWIEIPIDTTEADDVGADIQVPEEEGSYTISVGVSTDGRDEPNYPASALGAGASTTVEVQNLVNAVRLMVKADPDLDPAPSPDGTDGEMQFGEEDPAKVTVTFNTGTVVGIERNDDINIKLGATFMVPPDIDKDMVEVNGEMPKSVSVSGNMVTLVSSEDINASDTSPGTGVTVVFDVAAGIENPEYGGELTGMKAVAVYTTQATKPVGAVAYVAPVAADDSADPPVLEVLEVESGGVIIDGTMVDNIEVALMNQVIGGDTRLTVKFTTDDRLSESETDTITLDLAGFTLPGYISDGVMVNGEDADVLVEPDDETGMLEIFVPDVIEPSQRRRVIVEIMAAAGITNPTMAGKHDVAVKTSQENEMAIIHSTPITKPPKRPVAPCSVVVVSDEPGATSRMTVTCVAMDEVVPGELLVVTLEDDWEKQVSSSLDTDYITIRADRITNTRGVGSAAVEPAGALVLYEGKEHDMPSIRLEVPDMDLNEDGAQTIEAGSSITIVFNQGSGISNPTEGGKYDVTFGIMEANGLTVKQEETFKNHVQIPAQLVLDSDGGPRNSELTMVAKGVEGGESVTFWLDENRNGVREPGEADLDCTTVAAADDTATCIVTLNNPPFSASGKRNKFGFEDNFINFEDSEYRKIGSTDGITDGGSDPNEYLGLRKLMSNAVVELEPLVSISPETVNTGDRVTISLFDFQPSTPVEEIKIANIVVATTNHIKTSTGSTGEVSFAFEIPSRGLGGPKGNEMNKGLRLPTGKLRVDVKAGDTKDDVNMTIGGAVLTATATTVVANQDLSLSGSGYSSSRGGQEVCIIDGGITFNGVRLEILEDDDCGLEDARGNDLDGVELTSGGTFTLTVGIRQDDNGTIKMPVSLLTPGSHQLKVVDTDGTEGSIKVTIPERTLAVSPDTARPRDIVTIRGENFIADNPDGVNVGVDVEYHCGGRIEREVSAQPDASGNFTETLRIPTDCSIPSTNAIKAVVEVDNDLIGITDTVTHDIPEATVSLEPVSGAPGTSFSVIGLGYRTFETVNSVMIGGRETLSSAAANRYHTDRDGNLRIDNLLVPGMDSGTHPVIVEVGTKDRRTTASASFRVLELGVVSVPTGVMGAVEPLGDKLVRIFHFNNASKSWDFYDPRPEFAEANTIEKLFSGEVYWFNVMEDITVTLNNKTRNFTCIESDCWTQIVW